MRKVITAAFVSLDGVMQAPGGPKEDRTHGFELGGWVVPYVDEVFAYREQHPPDPVGWAAQAAAGAGWDADGRLARIAVPTLVVAGTADAVVDPRNAQLLAGAIPNAELELIDGAGHLPFWERAEEFARLVERFLG